MAVSVTRQLQALIVFNACLNLVEHVSDISTMLFMYYHGLFLDLVLTILIFFLPGLLRLCANSSKHSSLAILTRTSFLWETYIAVARRPTYGSVHPTFLADMECFLDACLKSVPQSALNLFRGLWEGPISLELAVSTIVAHVCIARSIVAYDCGDFKSRQLPAPIPSRIQTALLVFRFAEISSFVASLLCAHHLGVPGLVALSAFTVAHVCILALRHHAAVRSPLWTYALQLIVFWDFRPRAGHPRAAEPAHLFVPRWAMQV